MMQQNFPSSQEFYNQSSNNSFAPTDRGAILANLRKNPQRQHSHDIPSRQIPPRLLNQQSQNQNQSEWFVLQQLAQQQSMNNLQAQAQSILQYQQQQQDLNFLKQTSDLMELQLQQMRLQSLEIQERLLAANVQQNIVNPSNVESKRYVSDSLNSLKRFPSNNSDEQLAPQRFAQRNYGRSVSANGNLFTAPASSSANSLEVQQSQRLPGSRLSFGAANAAEHALARKALAAAQNQLPGQVSPPRTNSYPNMMSTPPSANGEKNHYHSSSIDSNSSQPPLGSRTLLASPTGPTLILSGPTEQFDFNSSGPSSSKHSVTSSDEESLDDNDTDDVVSFESMTSVNSSVSSNKYKDLNPTAPIFKPTLSTDSANSSSNSSTSSSPSTGSFKKQTMGRKTFSLSLLKENKLTGLNGGGSGVSIVRQPKGPAQDEDLPILNFASRIRRKAIGTLVNHKR